MFGATAPPPPPPVVVLGDGVGVGVGVTPGLGDGVGLGVTVGVGVGDGHFFFRHASSASDNLLISFASASLLFRVGSFSAFCSCLAFAPFPLSSGCPSPSMALPF